MQKIVLNNGFSMPIVGLGTWLSKPNEVKEAVKIGISCGYRHMDCAYIYGNEHEVGEAIAEKIQDGTVKREDLFITTKLFNAFHSPSSVLPSLKESLTNLKVDYIDLYLMHWPVAFKETPNKELIPKDDEGRIWIDNTIDYVDTYKAMENLVQEGLVRSIGVSNFNIDQMKRVVSNCKIIPAMLQVECHPLLSQKPLIEYCKSKGIHLTAYSPLGAPSRPLQGSDDPHLLSDTTVVSLAEKYNKASSQILIRYHIQNGVVVIPKSVTKSRIEENFNVFDFEISEEDMKKLESLDRNYRYIYWPATKHASEYPFKELL